MSPGRLALLMTAALAACGGGGSEVATGPDPVETFNAITGVVADGPLQGATVCYDLNDNGSCDAAEPTSSPTDANGNYSLEVPSAEAGKHEVIAMVPATAIDKDTGAAIGAALTLRTPATGNSGAQEVFVSALTTAVADVAKDSGKSVAAAVVQVQEALNLPVSPLANFVQGSGVAELAVAARALTGVMVETTRLAADSGVGAAQLPTLVRQTAINGLVQLGSALSANTSGAVATRVAEAVAAVKAEANLSPATVAAIAAVLVQPTGAADVPGPFVSVRRFAYTDANNYSYTLFSGDSSQLDANGEFVAHEVRKTLSGGVDTPFNRNQAYWTGISWETCALQWQVIGRIKVQTATTPQTSVYCPASKNEAKIATEDISGLLMRDVISKMRAHPMADSVGAHTNDQGLPVKWGPAPEMLAADAVFPNGSKLSSRVTRGDIGGTDRIELQNKSNVRWPDGKYRHATALEQYSGMPGNLLDATVVPSNANTVFVADLALAEQLDSTLEAFKRYRAGFDLANAKIRFYRCDVKKADQSVLNCVASDGTVAINTQGDARVMRVTAGYPADLILRQRGMRTWVERSGTVFRGMRDLESTRSDVRINGTAWTALRTALGIPEHTAPTAAVTVGPFGLLRSFTYTNPQNFSYRVVKGDSSLLDAAGLYTVNEERGTVTGGVETPFVRNQLMWTGSEWYDCPSDGLGIIQQNSVAPFASSFCKAYQDERAHRTVVTLAGRRMSDVVNDIRAYGSKDGVFDYGNWGTATGSTAVVNAATGQTVSAALATTVFPSGSTMEYRGTQRVATPVGFNTDAASQVRVAPSDPSVAFSSWPFAATLDEFVSNYPGDFAGGALNGATTMHVYQYFLEGAPSADYSARVDWRVAFNPSTGMARFYTANRTAVGDKPANFTAVLDTSYSIETLGGKRVLKFAAMPTGFLDKGFFQRMYTEHAGGVWYGWKDHIPAGPMWSVRLNQPAYEALGTALGITR